jgi:serine/threonine protein kinase
MQRFRREVAAAQAVSGAYTAAVLGAGPDDTPPWLATTYVPGPPLSDLVASNGPLPEDALWRLVGGLAEALQAIHAQGLVHRDLKPGNILIASDGPRVIDFGISRTTSGTVVTSTQTAIGTPAYMSPEQAQGLSVSTASDIFSLGSVLTFAATGVSPFGGGEMFAVGFRVVHGEPDLSGVPASLLPVVQACLAKDPAARPDLGQLLGTVATKAMAYPGIAPGKFWPDQVAAVLDSTEYRAAPPPPVAASASSHPVTSLSGPATGSLSGPATIAVPAPGGAAVPSPATEAAQPKQYPAPVPEAPAPVARRRYPRWLLPVVLVVAVAIAAGIAVAVFSSPQPSHTPFNLGPSSSSPLIWKTSMYVV